MATGFLRGGAVGILLTLTETKGALEAYAAEVDHT